MDSLIVNDKPRLRPVAAAPSESTVTWLENSARRLGLPKLPRLVMDDLRNILPSGLSDSAYAQNDLVPGGPPLEVSFAEQWPNVLRLDFAPYSDSCSPRLRCTRAAGLMGRWAAASFSGQIAHECAACIDGLQEQAPNDSATFGAFLGLTFDEAGLAETKIYQEWRAGLPQFFSKRLASLARTALATVPGLKRHFLSISCGRQRCVPRLYFLCTKELSLLALRPVLELSGLLHRLPELTALLLRLTTTAGVLPPGASVLSFREHNGQIDCKLEVLVKALPTPPSVFARAVLRFLVERPQVEGAFRDWCRAIGGDRSVPPSINAAGFRLSANAPARFAAYFTPPISPSLVAV
jgi:hypothetical protein